MLLQCHSVDLERRRLESIHADFNTGSDLKMSEKFGSGPLAVSYMLSSKISLSTKCASFGLVIEIEVNVDRL